MSLAFSAVNANQRVVLIDADLRHPSTSAFFRLEKKPGLVDFLTEHIRFGPKHPECGTKIKIDAFGALGSGANHWVGRLSPIAIYLTALGKAEGEATRTALLLKSIARHVNRSYWRDNSAAGCHRDRWHRLASRFSMNRGLRSAS
jgi:hypothetical protein